MFTRKYESLANENKPAAIWPFQFRAALMALSMLNKNKLCPFHLPIGQRSLSCRTAFQLAELFGHQASGNTEEEISFNFQYSNIHIPIDRPIYFRRPEAVKLHVIAVCQEHDAA